MTTRKPVYTSLNNSKTKDGMAEEDGSLNKNEKDEQVLPLQLRL